MIEILLHDCDGVLVLNETMLKMKDEIFDKNKTLSIQECNLKVREAWAKYCKENAVSFKTGEGDKAAAYLKTNYDTVVKIEALEGCCYATYDYIYNTLDYCVIEEVDTSKHWTIENFNLPMEERVRYFEQNCNPYNFIALQ